MKIDNEGNFIMASSAALRLHVALGDSISTQVIEDVNGHVAVVQGATRLPSLH
jgi:hypothetical protein